MNSLEAARPPSSHRRKILIVDDEPEVLRALTLRLKTAGYNIAVAIDGVSALTTAVREQPDLVLLDIGLPCGDGHFVADMLRLIPKTVQIPILFLSAKHDPLDLHSARQSGALGFITKPYDPEELLRRVTWALK